MERLNAVRACATRHSQELFSISSSKANLESNGSTSEGKTDPDYPPTSCLAHFPFSTAGELFRCQGSIWFFPMPSWMLAIKQSGGWRTTLVEVLLDQTAWTVVINVAHFISVGALSGACTTNTPLTLYQEPLFA